MLKSFNFEKYNNNCKCSRKIICFIIAGIVLIISACVVEYGYLTSLYLVDEYYEVKIPREITIKEKTTIRVVSTNSKASIIGFVSHYSICQCVHEIQILLPSSNSLEASKLKKQFIFTKTHSKVSVDSLTSSNIDKYFLMLYHDRKIETESMNIYIV